ncbi:putative adhesin [Kribbella kalugense]|uniref:Putative adhesin n=2 Tax=Kribbella kalugense TaxID=2512221 RepID=A0A4R8A490_9ACTN|nr:putative adhesin [Kribbella kalugense]
MRADSDCERATVTIQTADENGPAADAVRSAQLRSTPEGLETSVRGDGSTSGGAISGGGFTISGGTFGNIRTGRGITVNGMHISGGNDIVVNGVHITGAGGTVNVSQGVSPIEIVAVVPKGSSLQTRSDSADIEATGQLARVDANSVSGDVDIDRADDIKARTTSGDIRMGRTDQVSAHSVSGDISIDDFGGSARTETVSGDVRVHATEGGNLSAGSVSGNITVTASDANVAQQLNVQTSTVSGRVRTPQPAMSAESRRRDDSGGARNYKTGRTGPGQAADRTL